MSEKRHAYARCQAFIDSNFIESPRKKSHQPVALTISRQVFSHSHAIAELLIGLLELNRKTGHETWALFDRDLVQRILQDHNLPERIAKYMPEDKERAVTTTINEILGVHPSAWDLFHYTCDTIHKIACAGNAIIIGRGSNIITRGLSHVLRIRIISPMPERVARAQQLLGLSQAQAIRKINKEDTACAAYMRYHFDEDIADPNLYDMVLNTGSISEQSAANILYHALLAHHSALM